MVNWVNYVQMIAIMRALVVTKDYSMNIQLVFLEVRWTLDLDRGKLVH